MSKIHNTYKMPKNEQQTEVQLENVKIKLGNMSADSSANVRIEGINSELENKTFSSLILSDKVKMEAEEESILESLSTNNGEINEVRDLTLFIKKEPENDSEILSNFASHMEEINEVKASDYFVNTMDLVNVKQELVEHIEIPVKLEVFNEECDLPIIKSETDILEQPCSSQNSKTFAEMVKESTTKVKRRRRRKQNNCPICNLNENAERCSLCRLSQEMRKRQKEKERRANETPEQREKRLANERERKARSRTNIAKQELQKIYANIFDEKNIVSCIEEERRKNRERIAQRRANETPEQRERRLKIDRERKAMMRKREAEEKIQQQVLDAFYGSNVVSYVEEERRKNRERIAIRRANETPEQKERRLKLDRERKAKKRQNAAQNEIQMSCANMFDGGNLMSHIEEEKRKKRERIAIKRANETPEQRERRLRINRERRAQKIKSRVDDQNIGLPDVTIGVVNFSI